MSSNPRVYATIGHSSYILYYLPCVPTKHIFYFIYFNCWRLWSLPWLSYPNFHVSLFWEWSNYLTSNQKMLTLLSPLYLTLIFSITNKWRLTPSILFLLTTFSSSILSPSTKILVLSQNFSQDYLSAPIILLTLWVSAIIVSTRLPTTAHKLYPPSLNPIVMVLLLILVLTFSTTNFILFYIFFESSLIPTLFLILLWGYQPDRLQARIYIIIYTIAGSLPLLLGLLLLANTNNHLNIMFLQWEPPKTLTLHTWWFISTLAFLVKIPIYSLHLWLPKAHVEAPLAGSIILARILLKLGGYGMIRLTSLFQFATIKAIPILIRLSLWGAVITGFICLRQTDIKALIAYSSIAHISLVITGILSLTKWGWNGALTIILAHGLASPAIFSIANITYEITNTRSLFLTSGILTVRPVITACWFIFNASNIAAPPTINLVGEVLLLTATISKCKLFSILLAISTFLGAAYRLHLYTATQHGPLPVFINPMPHPALTHLTSLFLLIAPIIITTLKPELVSSWL